MGADITIPALIASLVTLFIANIPKIIKWYADRRYRRLAADSTIEIKKIENGAAQRREYREELIEARQRCDTLMNDVFNLKLDKLKLEMENAHQKERINALEQQIEDARRK